MIIAARPACANDSPRIMLRAEPPSGFAQRTFSADALGQHLPDLAQAQAGLGISLVIMTATSGISGVKT